MFRSTLLLSLLFFTACTHLEVTGETQKLSYSGSGNMTQNMIDDEFRFPYLDQKTSEFKVLTESGTLSIPKVLSVASLNADGEYITAFGTEDSRIISIHGNYPLGIEQESADSYDVAMMTNYIKHKNGDLFSSTSFFQIDEDEYVYMLQSYDQGQENFEGKAIFYNTKTHTKRELLASKFEKTLGKLTSMTPIGVSNDHKFVYFRMTPWEGFIYARVWKVDRKTLAITPVIEEKEKIGSFTFSAKTNQILAVSSQENPSPAGMGDDELPPSKVFLIDLTTGEKKLIEENAKLVQNPFFSPDGKQLFFSSYTKGECQKEDEGYCPYWNERSAVQLVTISSEDGGRHEYAGIERILAVSKHGKKVLAEYKAKTSDLIPKIALLDTKTGSQELYPSLFYTTESGAIMQNFQPIFCGGYGYGTGFDCHYKE
jgi:WD40 repeat protein